MTTQTNFNWPYPTREGDRFFTVGGDEIFLPSKPSRIAKPPPSLRSSPPSTARSNPTPSAASQSLPAGGVGSVAIGQVHILGREHRALLSELSRLKAREQSLAVQFAQAWRNRRK